MTFWLKGLSSYAEFCVHRDSRLAALLANGHTSTDRDSNEPIHSSEFSASEASFNQPSSCKAGIQSTSNNGGTSQFMSKRSVQHLCSSLVCIVCHKLWITGKATGCLGLPILTISFYFCLLLKSRTPVSSAHTAWCNGGAKAYLAPSVRVHASKVNNIATTIPDRSLVQGTGEREE